MILLENLGTYRKGRIWLENLPCIEPRLVEVLSEKITDLSQEIWERKSVCLELLLGPREISNYALLGVDYLPNEEKLLEIEVFVGADNDKILMDTIALSSDEVHVGLPMEYAETVLRTAEEFIIQNPFPPGKLSFVIGAHGQVGSSQFIFSQISKILLKILMNDSVSLTKKIEQLVLEGIE